MAVKKVNELISEVLQRARQIETEDGKSFNEPSLCELLLKTQLYTFEMEPFNFYGRPVIKRFCPLSFLSTPGFEQELSTLKLEGSSRSEIKETGLQSGTPTLEA